MELVGPPGIGKTRLLEELGRRAASHGHLVLTGSGSELEHELPFWVFVDALDAYLEGLEPRRLERLDAGTRGHLGTLLPSFSSAAGPPPGTLHERYRTHRAVRDLLAHLAATKPLLLVLDDVHWADSASIDLIVALLHRPPAARVLLALGTRPHQLPAALATALDRAHRAGTLARMELGALTREQTGELLGRPADDPLTAALYEETGGNPFYLEQLARAGGPRQDAGPSGADVALAGVEVPPMVVAALAEELAMLSASARALLDGAAVAGDPFEFDLAATAASIAEADALDGLDVLLRLDLVRATSMPRRFRFRHPIVRRAVYEATAGGWRLAAHQRIAETLAERGAGAATRAHHVERSARNGDAAAIAVLRDAGRQAALRAPATAAQWFAAALYLLPEDAPPDERVELLRARAQALAATGRFRESHAALLESIAIVPPQSPALRGQLAATCARIEQLLGQHQQAHDRLLDALGSVPDQGSAAAVSMMIELAGNRAHPLDYTGMEHWGKRAAEAGRRLDDPALKATAIAAYARVASFAGSNEQADAACTEAATLVDALADDQLAVRLDAAVHLAGAELYRHRFDEAGVHAQRALDVGRASGQGQLFPLAYAILGIVWWLQGRLEQAVGPLDGAIESARTTGNAQSLACNLYARSIIALTAGDCETALTTGQESYDLIDDGQPSHVGGWASRGLAGALLELGKAEQAAALLEGCAGGPDMPRMGPSWRSSALELLTRCRLSLDDLEAARRAAECADAAAAAVDLPLARAYADRAAAAVALHEGDPARAAELALASASCAEDISPMEAALARTLAGRALGQQGERDRAVAQLERAAAALDAWGAQRYRDAAEHELRRLGQHIHRRSQPSRPGGTGVGSLTNRELQIARLVVDRRTNREIAEALFLSRKTIEGHIHTIFRKLDADSRVEVARIIERADRLAASGP